MLMMFYAVLLQGKANANENIGVIHLIGQIHNELTFRINWQQDKLDLLDQNYQRKESSKNKI